MPIQRINGLSIDPLPSYGVPISLTNTSAIDATGEKAAILGRAWFPSRTTKLVRRVGFRFGTVVKAGGSGLIAGLQGVSLTAGPPGVPDEVTAETVAIANGDAAFLSNTWYRSGVLSSDRSVSPGELLAVVVEYDGSGRLGSDSFMLAHVTSAGFAANSGGMPVKTGAGPTWATTFSANQNVILECDDGTFGTLLGGYPMSAGGSAFMHVDSTPDERALAFQLPFPVDIDAIWAALTVTGNVELCLYEGTTLIEAVLVDLNTVRSNAGAPVVVSLSQVRSLLANTQYYVSVRPTTGTGSTVTWAEVADANHLVGWPGGPNFNYAERTGTGAAWTPTTTRRFAAGICPIGFL